MKLHEIINPRKNKYGYNILLHDYMYQTKEEIQDWCKRVFPNKSLHINHQLEIEPAEDDLDFGLFGGRSKDEEATIDVKGQKVLPVQFAFAINFDLGNLELNSFVGCPIIVHRDFECDEVTVTSLEGMPTGVFGNRLKLAFRNSTLQNLEGFPTIGENTNVTLVNRGTPNSSHSKILSLKGIDKNITDLSIGCCFSNIKDLLVYCPNLLNLCLYSKPDHSSNPGFLNLMKMKKLKGVDGAFSSSHSSGPKTDFERACDIFNKHLEGERDIIDCQEELITSGLKNYAKL
jgi:hypothetical protein